VGYSSITSAGVDGRGEFSGMRTKILRKCEEIERLSNDPNGKLQKNRAEQDAVRKERKKEGPRKRGA
jgi:hypothetical protein